MKRVAAVALVLMSGVACFDFGEHVSDVPLVVDDDSSETATPNSVTVELEGIAFVPSTVEIPVGGQVTWHSNDTVFHIVRLGTPHDPSNDVISDEINFGEEWSHIFDTAGDYVYFCDNHDRTMFDAHVIVGD